MLRNFCFPSAFVIKHSGSLVRTITVSANQQNYDVNKIGPVGLKVSTQAAEEIDIVTPFGHLAGKIWNKDGKKTPIIACHGWLDNAGTWDHLCPFLDTNYPVIAMDFPGHGLSSPKPLGFSGYIVDNILTIERIIRHFKFQKVILLGHSLGGVMSMLYSGTFPSKVEKLVMMDLFKPVHVDAENQPETTAKSIQEHLEIEDMQHTAPPRYTYRELVEKHVSAYQKSLSEESAKTLLKRGSQKFEDNTYSYSHSPLIKIISMLSLNFDQLKSYASKLNCELLIMKFDRGPVYGKKEILRELINIYRTNSSKFVFEVVSGTHHAHLNSPEIVAPLINEFLNDIPQDAERKSKSDQFFESHFIC